MSTALTNWRSERAEHIDELVDAHERLGGSGPGRRWGTEPINWALTVRLVAQFQGFARDLHDEAVEHVVADGEVIERAKRPGRPFPVRLLLGWVGERPIHVLVADDPVGRHYVITVYEPIPDRWSDDFRERREHR